MGMRLSRSGRASLVALATVAGGAIAALMLGVATLYVACPFYLEPDEQPFRGAYWYNPYDSVDTATGGWHDANFHAHAVAWGGVTNGHQRASDVATRYRALGYDVVGISDYHVAPDRQPRGVFPVYEHGWNIQKAHRLVLGGGPVSYLDYPLGQSRHQQQHILDRLRADAPLVAVVHPRLRNGHSAEALRRLTGYQLLEVFNHFTPPADAEWDAALSAGQPVWLLADDDSHNVESTGQTGVNRTRIHALDASPTSVIEALRAGRAYGLHGTFNAGGLALVSQRMLGDTFEIRVRGRVQALRVVGMHGVVRAEHHVEGAVSGSETILRWIARADDAYLRAIAVGPEGSLLYTNPVIRWNGRTLPHVEPQIDRPRTLLWRASWAISLTWVAALVWAGRITSLQTQYA